MQPSPLNPATAERLVILRFMLTEAQQRCRDGTSVGRHIGLLTLQDTCELAMILVLDDLGEQHAETERFDDLYSKVAEKLPDKAWKPRNQWASVRLMNRARNGAQHHGQRADKDQLNQWVTAADTFVRSLITSQFGIDLRTAVAATAIADQTLRQDLSDAEEALYDGRITESVQRAAAVFDLARRRWHRQLNDIDSRSHAGRAHHPHDEIDMLTDRLDDLEEVRHFAPDTIGHLRINHLARSLSLGPPDLPVLSEEAEQVLAFVFGWILRWEAVSVTFDGNRLQRHWASLRPPSTVTPEIGARVDPTYAVITTQPAHTNFMGGIDPDRIIYSAQLRIVDAPEPGFSLWSRALAASLRQHWTPQMPGGSIGTGSWQTNAVEVNPRGLLTLSAQEQDFDLHAIAATVREAVVQANQALANRRTAIRAWDNDHEGLAPAYRAVLGDLVFHDRPVVSDVQLEPAGDLSLDAWAMPKPSVVIQISPDLLSEVGITEHDLWLELPQLMLGQNGMIRVDDATEPQQIAKQLLASLKRTSERAREQQAAIREQTQQEASYRRALFAELNQTGADGGEPLG